MAIAVTCQACQRAMNLKDEAAGKRVRCPGCGKIVEVPFSNPTPMAEAVVEQEPAPAEERPEPRRKRSKPRKRRRSSSVEREPWFTMLGIDFTPVVACSFFGGILMLIVGVVLLFSFTNVGSWFSNKPKVEVVDVYMPVNSLRYRAFMPGVNYTIPGGEHKILCTRENPSGRFLFLSFSVPYRDIDKYYAGSGTSVTMRADNVALEVGSEKLTGYFVTSRWGKPRDGFRLAFVPPMQEGHVPNIMDYLGPGRDDTWTHEGTVSREGAVSRFEGKGGMQVSVDLDYHDDEDSARRQNAAKGVKLPGLDKLGSGGMGGADAHILVTCDAHSDLWLLTADLPVPNDISRSWSMQYIVPRPKGPEKEATLVILGSIRRSVKLP